MRLRVPIPPRWRRYPCRDYFASKLALTGWYDEEGQYWYIVPASRVREDKELELIIGAPGVDGLDWGYRRGHAGVWVYYPIGREWRCLAPTATALRKGYASGAITV